ncbi:MAG: hypothetical protein ACRET4_18575 [Steroidobacteraceae bacterium]
MFRRLSNLAAVLPGRDPVPSISRDTFIVWEPCSYSHAEVVPGYVKYLLDLGYQVSVFLTPKRFEEGLFSRFDDSRVSLNRLSQAAIRRFFKNHRLAQARGILITTARKISGSDNYDEEYALFSGHSAEQKVLLVEHDAKAPVDNGSITPQVITLRKIHYKNAATTVVNPHYFGKVKVAAKTAGVVNFITIGALRGKRRNTGVLIDAAERLRDGGITNFKITIVGRGSLRGIPRAVRKHFHPKGRLDFSHLYEELERSDFFLTLLDPENPLHERYITTGTSGSFQLIYGFQKPCLIAEKFARPNGFDNANSIVYGGNSDLARAMSAAVRMTPLEYDSMQSALKKCADAVYAESLENLRRLIEGRQRADETVQ